MLLRNDMAILETIAAANAAYGVIRSCLQNGKEVTGLVSEVGKFLHAEETLQEEYKKRKDNPLAKVLGKDISDWEHFQHLEEMKQKRKELEEWCRLYAPAGTWDRWVKFQADARIARKEARRRAEREREERQELIVVILCIVGGIAGLAGAIWWIGRNAGKW
jgi:hypothetical protein